jgi:hypothetical protein
MRHAALLIAGLLSSLAVPAIRAQDDPEQDRIERIIGKAGGYVEHNSEGPNSAIVSVDLHAGTKDPDGVLKQFRGLKQLRSLHLAFSDVTDVGLAWLSGMKIQRDLDLGPCYKITDAGLKHLAGLTDLEDLDLNGCELVQLRRLDLSSTGVTDAGLARLKGFHRLEDLAVSENVTDAGLRHLEGLTSLKELNLAETHVTDAGIKSLKTLTQLRRLVLAQTQLTDEGLAQLKGLEQLRYLDLCETSVTDRGLAHFRALTGLKDVRLVGTRVTEEGVKSLKKALPRARIIRTKAELSRRLDCVPLAF